MPIVPIAIIAPEVQKQASLHWKPLFDSRVRYERRIEKDFNEAKSDNRVDFFNRFRIGTSVTDGNKWSGRFLYQYADLVHQTPKLNNSEDRSDVIEFNLTTSTMGGTVTVGRQQFVKGVNRLFDEGNFGATGNYFDMLRWRCQNADIFAATAPVQSRGSRFAKFMGGSYNWRLGESMAVFSYDGTKDAKKDLYTFSHLLKQPLKFADLTVEGIGQLGRLGTQPVRAWAGTARLSRALNAKCTFYVDGNIASGGSTGSTRRTFDPLFGSFHGYYGIMDVLSVTNLQELATGISYMPLKRVTLSAEYHRYGLHDATDGLYTNGLQIVKSGAKSLIDTTGHSGTDIGQEFSLESSWKPNKEWTFSGGVGLFQPGRFIRTLVGPTVKDQTWGYLQAQMKF